MELFDTASKKLVVPEWANDLHIYVCGITPYDAAHLGHIFTFAAYDILQRILEDSGHTVQMVRNITDVDDPIYTRAASLGIDYKQLAANETMTFQAIMKRLNFRSGTAEPLASQYISNMAEEVHKLLLTNYAYELDNGDIYFDTTKVSYFGDNAGGFSNSLKLHFMNDRGGDIDRKDKKNQLDFLLWKRITDTKDPAAWDSVVGHGRPGWHIECSAMSSHLLKDRIDVHGGGMDLIFPHHEAEAAQNLALSGSTNVSHWMHVAPLLYNGEKMSKSLGNLVFASQLLKHYEPGAIRLALMNYHYRIGGEWQHHFLDDAVSLMNTIRKPETIKISSADSKVFAERIYLALNHDLDTPEVMRILIEWAREGGRYTESHMEHVMTLLGIEQ